MRIAKLFVFVLLAYADESAYGCYQCAGGGGGGYPSCNNSFAEGAQICVGSPDPPYCTTYDNSCVRECLPCPPYGQGWCASAPRAKGKCTLKKAALEIDPPPPGKETTEQLLARFLADAEKGAFDKTTVHMQADGPVVKALLKLPANHWKSFIQRMVIQPGPPMVFLDIVTKSGHKLLIQLDKAPVKGSKLSGKTTV